MYILRNITRRYGEHGYALDLRHLPDGQSTLEIPQGKLIAIMGYSGSGKSTLLNILALLDKPDTQPQSRLEFQGEEMGELSDERASKIRKISFGFAFQRAHHVFNLSARKNLLLPLMLDGQSLGSEALETLKTRLNLAHQDLERSPKYLSQGESHRIALGRALLHDPQVVFADEPEGNLDPETGYKVLQELKAWQRAGDNTPRTILWVTHNIELAAQFADHLLVLRAGQLNFTGPMPAKDGSHGHKKAFLLKALGMIQGEDIPPAHDFRNQARIAHPRWQLFWQYAKSDLWPSAKPLWQKPFFTPTLSITLMMLLSLFTWQVIGGMDRYFDHLLEEAAVTRVSVGPQNTRTGESVSLDGQAVDRILALKADPSLDIDGVYGLRHSRLYINHQSESKAFSGLMLQPADPYLQSIPNLNAQALRCDPGLKIPIKDEAYQRALKTAPQDLADAFKGTQPPDYGIIVTPNLLCKLGYDSIPASLDIEAKQQLITVPILGISDGLLHGEFIAPYGLYLDGIYGGRDIPRFTELHIYLSSPFGAENAINALVQAGFDPERRAVELARWVQNVMAFLSTLGAGGLLATLLICVANIALVFKGLIREKQKDIGMLRAIGANQRDIFNLYLLEGGLLWLGAAITTTFCMLLSQGFIITHLLSLLEVPADRALEMGAAFELAPHQFFVVIFGGLLITLMAQHRALRSALKLTPADGLREG